MIKPTMVEPTLVVVDLEEPTGDDASPKPSTSTGVSHATSSESTSPRRTTRADHVVSKKVAIDSGKFDLGVDSVCFFLSTP